MYLSSTNPCLSLSRNHHILYSADGNVKFLTKGDNNNVDDRGLYAPGQLWLTKKDVVGRARGFLPYVGIITIFMNEYPKIKVPKDIKCWYVEFIINPRNSFVLVGNSLDPGNFCSTASRISESFGIKVNRTNYYIVHYHHKRSMRFHLYSISSIKKVFVSNGNKISFYFMLYREQWARTETSDFGELFWCLLNEIEKFLVIDPEIHFRDQDRNYLFVGQRFFDLKVLLSRKFGTIGVLFWRVLGDGVKDRVCGTEEPLFFLPTEVAARLKRITSSIRDGTM